MAEEWSDGEGLKSYLKNRVPNDPLYVEVNIKSKSIKVTKGRREECVLQFCKITGKSDEKEFQLVNSIYAKQVKFSEVEKWRRDEHQPDKKIDLYLKNKVVVLYINEKLELEDL